MDEFVRVGEFLVRHANEHFCDDCLSVKLEADHGDVRRAIVRLSTEIVLHRVESTCVGCARDASVIGLISKYDDPVDRVMAFFAQAPGGQGFCHACLAIVTGLSYLDVRKTVDRLRLTSLRVSTGACGRCGRLRVQLHMVSAEPGEGGLRLSS
jgi:hypothetical protein